VTADSPVDSPAASPVDSAGDSPVDRPADKPAASTRDAPPDRRREAIVAKRMPPDQRREAIVAAALDVAVVKGLASTTVRDVAARMGTSSGLIHHYFASMDDVLAAAFELVATQDLGISERLMAEASTPVEALRVFFQTYTPADKDWAFQLWLDAWAEAARRPAVQATSRRLNLEWQALLARTIRGGVASGAFTCPDPDAAAWRILSLLDGLALQVVAHGTTISREDVVAWSTTAAERELGLTTGTLG
jgi:AcrR family transcriptional regulator